MIVALQEQSLERDHNSQVARLEREFNNLRSPKNYTTDHLSQSLPGGLIARVCNIGLQELVERELNAHGGATTERGSMHRACSRESRGGSIRACSSQRRAQSITRHGAMTERAPEHHSHGIPEYHSPTVFRTDSSSEAQVKELYKELEEMDNALQESRRENSKLKEDKDQCIAAHERDVASLEHMLKSVMDENQKLQEALSVAVGKKPPKLTPRGMPEAIERTMISNLIQSGISGTPSSLRSAGSPSASTGTPPSTAEPEAEEWGEALIYLPRK